MFCEEVKRRNRFVVLVSTFRHENKGYKEFTNIGLGEVVVWIGGKWCVGFNN